MTDAEIIKALECCISNDGNCDICPQHSGTCVNDLLMSSLDLINRQKAEIEKCVNTLCKKEDMMQLIAEERQQYYDELQTARAEIDRLNKKVCELSEVLPSKRNGG